VFGIIEVGRLALTYGTLAHAARTGLRYAVVHGGDRPPDGTTDGASGPVTAPRVIEVVQAAASAGGVSSAQVTVSYCSDGSQPNVMNICLNGEAASNAVSSPVTITVTYTFTSVISILPLTIPLQTTTQGVICY
jgi:hypothetical protein